MVDSNQDISKVANIGTNTLNKIKIIESLIKDVEQDSLPKGEFKSVQLSINSLNELLTSIHGIFANLEVKYQYHTTKYFHKWRSFDCREELRLFKEYSNLLHDRLEIFKNVILILK